MLTDFIISYKIYLKLHIKKKGKHTDTFPLFQNSLFFSIKLLSPNNCRSRLWVAHGGEGITVLCSPIVCTRYLKIFQ